jgi:uncharacterized protein YndB with AHSA1/START domain
MTDLRIDRHFDVDPTTVFDFVTKANRLLEWWGPEGMSVPEHDLDLSRPGRKWWSVMVGGDGRRYKVSGEVVAVDPPRSVEFTWGWHDEHDERGHESRVRFEIMPGDGGGTHFALIHSGLTDAESATNHEMGWSSSLKKLERMASNT